MAITIDTIVDKKFKIAEKGYDKEDVDSFLDSIIEEMENREKETKQLQEKVESLTSELNKVQTALKNASSVQNAAPKSVANEDRHAAESFELVLSKAKDAYEEIVSAADARAEEIISKANEDASNIRVDAQKQITDLTEKLTALRTQAAVYYDSMKKAMDTQAVSMEQIKKLL